MNNAGQRKRGKGGNAESKLGKLAGPARLLGYFDARLHAMPLDTTITSRALHGVATAPMFQDTAATRLAEAMIYVLVTKTSRASSDWMRA